MALSILSVCVCVQKILCVRSLDYILGASPLCVSIQLVTLWVHSPLCVSFHWKTIFVGSLHAAFSTLQHLLSAHLFEKPEAKRSCSKKDNTFSQQYLLFV